MERAKSENWQAELTATNWNDNDLEDDCFEWLTTCRSLPSSTTAGAQELYQQLLPTKVYQQRRTGLNPSSDVAEFVANPKIPRRTC
ncbi:unnamed protein product [Porites lobata]|uniref:Uncharacterized protein n=1 Tax=Porites lobata TaxID=104759 RepID=A0ABN8MVX1_9CNID|nr:unnamed protein product [Porites lobata]